MKSRLILVQYAPTHISEVITDTDHLFNSIILSRINEYNPIKFRKINNGNSLLFLFG